MKRAQVFTTDLIIAITIFLLVFGIIMLFFYQSSRQSALSDLVADGKTAANTLTAETGAASIMRSGKEADYSKLSNEIATTPYDELRSELGIQSDYCILLVDLDNKVVPIKDRDGIMRYSIGADTPIVNISGLPCGGELP